MTLIIVGALAGALIASLLVDLDRRNRKHAESRHQEIRQRVLASQAAPHRAEADKLIPRFAGYTVEESVAGVARFARCQRQDDAPGGEGP